MVLKNGGTGSVKNCVFDETGGTASAFDVDNCLVLAGSGGAANMTNSVFFNVSAMNGSGDATNCKFIGCTGGKNTFLARQQVVHLQIAVLLVSFLWPILL